MGADPAEAGQPPAAAGTHQLAPAAEASQPATAAEAGQPPTAAEAGQPAAASQAGPAVPPEGPPSPPTKRAKPRKLLYVTLPGCWGAIIFAALSFTPSLLPRGGVIQGVICGITAAIGYGLAVWAASIWRAFADRDPRQPRRWAWRTFFISAVVLFAVAFGLGQYWQYEIRKLMGVTEYNIPLAVASPFIAALFFCLFLLIGRGLRGLYRWVAKLLSRWIGSRAARGVGWVLVVGLTYLVVSGLLLQGFVNLMNAAYGTRDTKTAEGIHQPTTSLRSGGPGSLIPWDTLGWQGRNFIGKGPSTADIEKFTGHPATEPIRIYAGLASAKSAEAQAALAVKDLQRAGGFQRKYLAVVTTTGSGWVDPALVDSFEYLTGGDCATVAIQYSYLPSWISYLVDQAKALAAGRALFDAVYGVWAKMPAGDRPKLYVAGESLGSFGGEAAFTGENDLANRTNGALFAGPAQLQHAVQAIQRQPRPGQPRGRADLPGRADRAVHQRREHRNPAGGPALERHPGPVPDAPVRPDRLVEPAPDLQPAGLDQRAARQGRAQDHVLDAFHNVLAGHRRPSVRHRRSGGHGHTYSANTSTGGTPCCGLPGSPPRTWPTSGRSSRT